MSIKSDLYLRDNFIADIPYLINTDVKYYDISKANISILYDKGLLTYDGYNRLFNLPKIQREIEVGIMMRDRPEIKEALKDGFVEARKMLFDTNSIEDKSVLSIKKDAVYVINRTLMNTHFGNVIFALGGTYTSFYKLMDLEIYYNANYDNMDVKGINDNIIALHDNFFKEILSLIFTKAERQPLPNTIADIKYIIELYTNMKLDQECYREFNRTSSFRFKNKYNVLDDVHSLGVKNLSEELSKNFEEYIDISYNYNILMQLYYYYFNQYMGNNT